MVEKSRAALLFNLFDVKMSEFSIEDLKTRKELGILTNRYIVTIRVPRGYVINPAQGEGISYLSVIPALKGMLLTCQHTSVKKVNKKSVVLELTVAEPYLRLLHRELSKVESAVLIKGEDNE